MLTGYNYHTIPMEKVLQTQAKSFLAKSRNQDEDPCPNLPEIYNGRNIRKRVGVIFALNRLTPKTQSKRSLSLHWSL